VYACVCGRVCVQEKERIQERVCVCGRIDPFVKWCVCACVCDVCARVYAMWPIMCLYLINVNGKKD